jgi:excinuclease ABC subunit A
VQCKNLRGPFQEVEIRAYSWQEIDTPAFWKFLDAAIAGFRKFTERLQQSPEDVMPWKVLGRKWHLARKGFPPGKAPAWNIDVLEELLETLGEIASTFSTDNGASSSPQFLWNNQQVIHLMVAGQREPWATVHTKRLAGVDLALNGPAGAFATGRIAELGSQRAISSDNAGLDQVKFRFVKADDLHRGDLAAFLAEHLQVVRSSTSKFAAS